jgi:hypothetical protein
MGRLAILALAVGCGRVGFRESIDACGDACARPRDARGDGPPMVSGTYAVTPAVTYSCALGLVDISYTQLAFADTGSALTVTSNDVGNPAQPCPMTGASAAGGHVDVTCTLPGSCNETYSLLGDFAGSTTWTGSFRASYTGTCLDCVNQMVAITGTR